MKLLYDPVEGPEYQNWINDMAQHCHCEHPWPIPCDGVLAGGLCDGKVNKAVDETEQ